MSAQRDGAAVCVAFRGVAGGLRGRDSRPLAGFELAGKDGRFRPAAAQPVDARTLSVGAAGVEAPAAVRYAWAPDPDGNLVNSEGLPASPFVLEL